MSWPFSRTDEVDIEKKMEQYKQAVNELERATRENDEIMRKVLEEVVNGPKRK